ncbi:hypothetical protein LVJ94_24965 [Pendulispora rubella]|uniref:Uncharacterized protein n=1 Tax=Pendulispora rubella TaxID=2741070 RepID=A0ABZ2LNI8_9BACT
MRRPTLWCFCVPFVALLVAGCVSSGASGGGGGDQSGSCGSGVSLAGDKWGSECDTWLAQNCCDYLRACSGDSGCAQLVACMNRCPSNDTDACSATCKGRAPSVSISIVDAIGDCSRVKPTNNPAIPSTCQWP